MAKVINNIQSNISKIIKRFSDMSGHMYSTDVNDFNACLNSKYEKCRTQFIIEMVHTFYKSVYFDLIYTVIKDITCLTFNFLFSFTSLLPGIFCLNADMGDLE